MSVTVQISLPTDVYRVLSQDAERLGTQTHRLVSAATVRAVRGEGARQSARLVERASELDAREAAVARRETELETFAATLNQVEEVTRMRLENRVRQLNGLGWSDALIADELGLTQSKTNRLRRRLGLPTVGKPGPRKAA